MKIAWKTIIYYTLAIGLIVWCHHSFRSGPCTPNLDLLSVLLIFPLSFALLVRSSIFWIKGHRDRKIATLTHCIGFGGLAFYLFCLS